MGEHPRAVIGGYALYGEIASGGAATVYFGRRVDDGAHANTVAIKRLHPQNAKNPELAAMFVDEARIASRIRHPNVVPVHDVTAVEGELLLVMEYVPGETLHRLLGTARERTEAVPGAIASALLLDILRGLAAAHESRGADGELIHLVHRDVSPQNVIVGQDGIARIVDFGVAKALGRSQATTDEGRIKGKAAYMSPEQVLGEADLRTDIWAASVVAWEMLAGARLFASTSDIGTLQEVLTKDVPPLDGHRPDLPRAFLDAVLKGLARSPLDRWSDARVYADAVAGALAPASRGEIEAWVEQLAAPALRRRELLVRGLAPPISSPELKSSGDDTTTVAVEAPSRRMPRRTLAAALLTGVVALAAIALALAGAFRQGSTTSIASGEPATPTAASSATAPPPAVVASASSEPAPPSAVASSETVRTNGPHLGKKARPVPAPPAPRTATSRPSVCSYVDAEGIVKFRACN